MNKVTAIYELFKNVKEMDCHNGEMDSILKFGDATIMEGHVETSKQEGKYTKKVEINFGEEAIKFERTGNFSGCCGGFGHGQMMGMHHGMHSGMHKGMHKGMHGDMNRGMHRGMHGGMNRGHMHGFGGQENCCEYDGQENFMDMHSKCRSDMRFRKVDKALMLLKLLDKTVYDEASKQIILELSPADMSENMKAHFEKHLMYKKVHLKKMMSYCEGDEACCNSDHQRAFKHLVDAGIKEVDVDSITPKQVKVVINVDDSIKPIAVQFDLAVDTKLQDGTEKPIRFSLKGKML